MAAISRVSRFSPCSLHHAALGPRGLTCRQWAYAWIIAKWSLCMEPAKCTLWASSAIWTNGVFRDRNAARTAAGLSTRNMAAWRSILATIGCTGREAMARPKSVRAPSGVRAFMSCSSATALAMDSVGGHAMDWPSWCSTSPPSMTLHCSTTSSSGLDSISGTGKSARRSRQWEGNRCTTTPTWHRPARPLRCIALARVTSDTSREDTFLSAS
mmetsp:Transcript_141922/g.247395  ORF Transcript_141922/g.247395 Transcript_141922/m.247395 type:complete len:213 (+) Transcript_141922:533-1171(+)